MNFAILKNKLLYMVAGMAVMAPALSSCHLDEPEPIPAEELYLRAFIKQYGLIDPEQDWNLAQKANVTVRVPESGAQEVTVFIQVGPAFYRLAYYVDVVGTVTIPVDIPDGVDKVYVQVDGRIYTTTPGGYVDAAAPRKAPSRAAESLPNINIVWKGGITINMPTAPDSYVGDISMIDDSEYENLSYGTALVATNTNHVLNITNTVQGAEGLFLLHNTYQVDGTNTASPFVMTFDVEGASASQVDIAIYQLSGSEFLNQTVEIPAGNSTQTLYIHKMPDDAWANMYIKVRQTSGTAGTIKNIRFDTFNPGDMAWLLVAEDLGATDDFDFNDIIVRVESTTMNEASLKIENEYWQVINDEDTHLVLGAPAHNGGSRARSYTRLRVSSLAAGGILDSFLHFRNGDKDFILGPGQEIDLTGTPTTAVTEWHEWFDEGGNASQDPNLRHMLNTGLNTAGRRYCTIIVPDGFSMERYSVNYKNYDGVTNKNPGASESDWDRENYLDWDPTLGNTFNIQGFYMTVRDPDPTQASAVLSAPMPGAAPQMFLIPDAGWGGYWHWPRERVPITRVYPRFKDWVILSGANANWYLDTPASSAISNEGQTIGTPYISIGR